MTIPSPISLFFFVVVRNHISHIKRNYSESADIIRRASERSFTTPHTHRHHIMFASSVSCARRTPTSSPSSSSCNRNRVEKATKRGGCTRVRAAAGVPVVFASGATPKPGERVSLHYKMSLADGTVVDDTRANPARGNAPVVVTLGDESLFPKIATELQTMSVGDSREVALPAKEAFGERSDEKVQSFPLTPEERESMSAQVAPGQLVQLPDGSRALCLELRDDAIVLDLNHPLAGQDLTFQLELVEIMEALNIFGVPMVNLKL
jgi:FKBP-type peptidyl-prolyl cis-trans isomerase 2